MQIFNDKKDMIIILRELREKQCFPVVNRGKVWYDRLSSEQLQELKDWYNDWLNVTETMIIPVTPSFINEKLLKEEIKL